MDIKRSDVRDNCVAFVEVRGTPLIFARLMSSRSLRAKLLMTIRHSAAKKRSSYAKHQARCLVLCYLVGED